MGNGTLSWWSFLLKFLPSDPRIWTLHRWLSDNGLDNMSVNACTMSQISCKTSPIRQRGALSKIMLRRSASCTCVCLMTNEFPTWLVPARASTCKARKESKAWVVSLYNRAVNDLSQKSRTYCTGIVSLSSVSKSTFSATSHLSTQTFFAMSAKYRMVFPSLSLWCGSAPDCSSDRISEFGAPWWRANIKGVIPVGGHRSTSAPA